MHQAGQRFRHPLIVVIFLGLLLAGLTACGQKGPLFMPPADPVPETKTPETKTDEKPTPPQEENPDNPQQDLEEE